MSVPEILHGRVMKYRKLRIVWSAASLFFCIVFVAAWVASYHWRLRVMGEFPTHDYMLRSSGGRIWMQYADYPAETRTGGWSVETRAYDRDDELRSLDGYFYSLDKNAPEHPLLLDYLGIYAGQYHEDIYDVITPYWLLTIISASLATVSWYPSVMRFSLRTLLIGMTVAAIGLGVVVYALS